MFVFGNVFDALAALLSFVFTATFWILLINALLSWVRPDPSNPIVVFLDRFSDVVCAPVRRLLPTVFGGIDFAPFIVMLLLQFVGQAIVVRTLRDMAVRMG